MTAVLARVSELAEQVRGVSYGKGDARDAPEEGYLPVLRAGNISDTGIVFDDFVYVPEALVSKKQLLRAGDVLIAASSGSLDVVGKAAPVLADFEGGFGAFCKVLRPKTACIDTRYFSHFFRTPEYRRIVSGLAAGANINNLRNEHLDDLLIPLPPLAEQRRIAAILDTADALRTKRRDALTQLDRLAQSIFVEMFGDPATNPRGWKSSQLGQICEVGSSKRVFVEELVDEGIAFYRGTEVGQLGEGEVVQPSLFISHDHYERLKAEAGVPRKGDLLLPSICPDGRIYTVDTDRPFYFKDARVLWIKVGQARISSTFLRHYLKLQFAKNYSKIASGTTFAELKIFALKSLDVHLPPMDLQRRFADAIAVTESQRLAAKSSYEGLSRLFQSLQYRAFRGEL